MITLSSEYNRKTSNCAHFVAQWFGVPSPENEREFILWMRRRFKPICNFEENCLVVAGPPLHVGIFTDWTVRHMENGPNGGQLVSVDPSMFKQLYKNVRMYRYGND